MSFQWNGEFNICGMERSGSTFVWQVLKELGCNATKSHSYKMGNTQAVKFYTYRDPRDVICSYARTVLVPEINSGEIHDTYHPDGSVERVHDAARRIAAYRLFYRPNARQLDYRCYMWEANQGAPIAFLKYEDYFGGNEEKLVEDICSFVSMFQPLVYDENLIKMIAKKYSREKNHERALKFDTFAEYDEETGIHGDHITHGGSTWRDDFSFDVAVAVDRFLGDFLIELGYETDQSWFEQFAENS